MRPPSLLHLPSQLRQALHPRQLLLLPPPLLLILRLPSQLPLLLFLPLFAQPADLSSADGCHLAVHLASSLPRLPILVPLLLPLLTRSDEAVQQLSPRLRLPLLPLPPLPVARLEPPLPQLSLLSLSEQALGVCLLHVLDVGLRLSPAENARLPDEPVETALLLRLQAQALLLAVPPPLCLRGLYLPHLFLMVPLALPLLLLQQLRVVLGHDPQPLLCCSLCPLLLALPLLEVHLLLLQLNSDGLMTLLGSASFLCHLNAQAPQPLSLLSIGSGVTAQVKLLRLLHIGFHALSPLCRLGVTVMVSVRPGHG